MPRWNLEEQTELAQLRAKAGLSRDKAAVMIGVAPNTLFRYESGRNDIGLEAAEKMALLYKVPFDAIREAAKSVRAHVKTPTAFSSVEV